MAWTINNGSLFMNTVLYAGNATARSITGVGFQPDWTWIKSRTNTEYHNLVDSVRGNTKYIYSNSSEAQATDSDRLTAFGSDGFSLGADDNVNMNSQNFVGWNWKESTTAGFDIVSYSGTGSAKTVAHNLSAVPGMIIVKRLDTGSSSWMVYHQKLGNTKYLSLDTTAAEDTLAVWNNTTPTSSVFSVGTDQRVNANGASYIAYVFAQKQGYSKFGSYVGNNNANGPMVYTGFKPAWIMIKIATGTTNNWMMYDNQRSPFNLTDKNFEANNTGAEGTSLGIDMLSNGFKIKSTGNGTNYSGGTYIYMAFAQNPITSSTGVPSTAR